jgi:predicted NAD/FAD-binding protein
LTTFNLSFIIAVDQICLSLGLRKENRGRLALFLNDRARDQFQVPICKYYLDPLSLATWMCFLATLQCMVMAFFLEENYLQIWKLASIWELPCILYGVSAAPSVQMHE